MSSVIQDAVQGAGVFGKVLGGLGGLGNIAGPAGSIANAIGGAQGLLAKKTKSVALPGPAQASPFNPLRPDALARPDSLSDYSGFTQDQERSALATRGINQGLGADEDAYYRNLIQRSLIGDNNQPASDTNSLLPVESQYFSQQGMNTSGIMDFLKQLQQGNG